MSDRLFMFGKAQVSAFIGGMVDYSVMILLTEFFGLHYTTSIIFGGIIGAFVNFSLNRYWTFHSSELTYKVNGKIQMLRFAVVVINSILLKASGTYYITSFFHIDYKISRIITDMIVSVVFNYMLQRHWVFKRVPVS
ncbi:MAG: GtrA family protein [Bacteroidales bacterium]|jgi:putative flippase GtrA|nr:GtrA family protein [Bacteroidales bacterium]